MEIHSYTADSHSGTVTESGSENVAVSGSGAALVSGSGGTENNAEAGSGTADNNAGAGSGTADNTAGAGSGTEFHLTVQQQNDNTSPPLTPMSPLIIVSDGGMLDAISDNTTDNNGSEAPPTSLVTVPPTGNNLELPSNALVRMDSVDDSMKDHPGFLFLTRNDFYEFVKVSFFLVSHSPLPLLSCFIFLYVSLLSSSSLSLSLSQQVVQYL